MPDSDQSPETYLASQLILSKKAVVLSGAGMSTGSGLPDYRGPSGLWRNKSLQDIAHINTYYRQPELLWAFYEERLESFRPAKPNSGHYAVAKLQQAGIVKGLITQNIDGLHSQAGSANPLEVHGSIREAVCPHCQTRTSMEAAVKSLATNDYKPPCPRCGEILKPGVILFGEMLPPAMDEAIKMMIGCDLLLVLGSSLQVHPVASLPAHVIKQGGQLVIINHSETPWDNEALLTFRRGISETLEQVIGALEL